VTFNNKTHNYTIDLLRFLAAFIVVLFHLNQPIAYVDNWYRNLVKYGWVGVPVFFVISGFCIMLAVAHSKSGADFLRRRFFRIFPAYWCSLVVVLLAAVFQKLYIGYNSILNIPASPSHILANITLLTWPFNKIPTINWVYWSLTCEVFFYLVVGLALLFERRFTGLILLLVSLAAALWPYQHSGYFFFLDHWPAFGCGLGLFYVLEDNRPLSWLLLGVNLGGLLYKYLPAGELPYIVATIVTLVIILLGYYIKLPENKLALLGSHAYAVYLIHVPIGVFILGLFKNQYVQQHLYANLTFDLFCYVVTSALAWPFFHFIEKPSIRYGKSLTNPH
jgi:peptidoglycan/LPS O-acetylase OafA/YrhL